jgi:hypothetical protein
VSELAWAGESPDVVTTKALRDLVASKFRTSAVWRTEFNSVALRKFANKMASVRDITSAGNITNEAAEDLKQELYQLILHKYESHSWKDILLSDSIMVSQNTAPLYGTKNMTIRGKAAEGN